MKKTLCIAFLSFILMSLSCVTASAASFKDVPSNYWANKEITWASDRGLMNGTTTTTFNPTGKTLRGQMTAILYRYAGSPAVEQASVYTDVTSANYYSDAAIWAVNNKIMEESRLASKTMDAGDPISRAEFCTMLLMFSIYSDTYVPPSAGTLFTDTGDLSSTMQWAIEWANCSGIVNGTSTTTFNPHGSLTRAAAAAMLYRYENYAKTDPQLLAEARAKELVEYYACPFPQMIKDLLVDAYGFSEVIAERAVNAAISNETWKIFAITKAEDFFYMAPKQPKKEDVRIYLTSSLGFPSEVAEYAVEVADISWNQPRTDAADGWISLADFENMGFTVNAGFRLIKLKYNATGEEYIMTGFPMGFTQGLEYTVDFNGVQINGMFFEDLSYAPNYWFFLDKYDLISAGILNSNGTLSSNIKNGLSQERMYESAVDSPNYVSPGSPSSSTSSSGSTSSGGGTSVTVPSHSETEGNLVWVPTKGGTKYHSKSSCSQMEDPIQVSIETAIANGYTACGRCH